MGWGEFEAKMTMHFKDPNENPVDVLHQLRLYHDPATGTTQPKKASKKSDPSLTGSFWRNSNMYVYVGFVQGRLKFGREWHVGGATVVHEQKGSLEA